MDISLTSPAMVVMERDTDSVDIPEIYFATETARIAKQHGAWRFQSKLPKKTEEFRLGRLSFLYSKTVAALIDERPELVAIEDYGFMGKGAGFYVVELTGMLKHWLWQRGIPFRLYDPQAVKQIATGKGNADKQQMIEAAEFCIHGPGENLSKYGKAAADIADAFFVAYLLHHELRARENPNIVPHLSDKAKRVLNRVTKSNPVNILARDFIQKA